MKRRNGEDIERLDAFANGEPVKIKEKTGENRLDYQQ